jgi:hypothetical protein
MPMPQALIDPDDPDPPANQLDDDGSIHTSEPNANSGVEEMNFEPDEMDLDQANEDPTNPGVEPDDRDKVDHPMDEH